MDKRTLVVAAAGVVVGGSLLAVYACCKNGQSADDDVDFAKKPVAAKPAKPAASATGDSAKATVEKPKSAEGTSSSSKISAAASQEEIGSGETSSTAMFSSEPSTTFMREYSFAHPGAAESAAAPAAAASASAAPPASDDEGVIHFEKLGLVLQLARGWVAKEDAAPMPNIAMIQLMKEEHLEAMQSMSVPGQVPVVMMSIEDVSSEGLTVDEYKEKTKQMSLGQLAMMTQGMFEPQVHYEAPQSNGPFCHTLELKLATPWVTLRVLNLICLEQDIAYVLRVMCQEKDYDDIKPDVFAMAKACTVCPKPAPADFSEVSFIEYTTPRAAMRVPSLWSIARKPSSDDSSNLLAVFTNNSGSKPEEIMVHQAASMADVLDISGWKQMTSDVVDGITVQTFKELGRTRRLTASNGSVTVSVRATNGLVTSPATAKAVLSSVAVKAAAASSLRFVQRRMLFAFEIEEQGRILESRIGESSVVYAPKGFNPDDEGPILTVRIGDPSNDPDCRPTLEEWLERIRGESKELGDASTISGLKKETTMGPGGVSRECVSFLNKEMVEVGPGQKEERLAKVVIFLKGVRTTMLRWEAPSGMFYKSERKFQSIVQSLEIL